MHSTNQFVVEMVTDFPMGFQMLTDLNSPTPIGFLKPKETATGIQIKIRLDFLKHLERARDFQISFLKRIQMGSQMQTH